MKINDLIPVLFLFIGIFFILGGIYLLLIGEELDFFLSMEEVPPRAQKGKMEGLGLVILGVAAILFSIIKKQTQR